MPKKPQEHPICLGLAAINQKCGFDCTCTTQLTIIANNVYNYCTFYLLIQNKSTRNIFLFFFPRIYCQHTKGKLEIFIHLLKKTFLHTVIFPASSLSVSILSSCCMFLYIKKKMTKGMNRCSQLHLISSTNFLHLTCAFNFSPRLPHEYK